MIKINDKMKEYMTRQEYKNIVLDVELFESWCAPPRKEITVSFTDKSIEDMALDGYSYETCETCCVFFPTNKLAFTEESSIDYIVLPWIYCCSAENVKIL